MSQMGTGVFLRVTEILSGVWLGEDTKRMNSFSGHLIRREIKIALFPLTCRRRGRRSVGRKIFLFFVYFFLS